MKFLDLILLVKHVQSFENNYFSTNILHNYYWNVINQPIITKYLLGGLLLLLLLLLGITVLLRGLLHNLLLLLFHLLLFLLDSNKQAQDLLGLAHVVLVHLELVEDVVNLGLGHLVSPGAEGVLEHLDVNLAVLVVGGESLDDELVGVVAVSGHLALEHVNHALEGAGATNLSHQIVQFGLRHEDTNVVEGSTEVILVQGAVLVDVHQLETVLVHLDLLLGEASLFILSLAHYELLVLTCSVAD